ncbi:hypothetical protein FACS1894187_05520 [Synergistales bacterium]|nr:hypothetical protein FACS1894187_05520 [Synergistales bacterium]
MATFQDRVRELKNYKKAMYKDVADELHIGVRGFNVTQKARDSLTFKVCSLLLTISMCPFLSLNAGRTSSFFELLEDGRVP